MAHFRLASAAAAAGYRLQGFDTIGSTNSEAMAAARDGDGGNLWLASLQQTAGRGRRGRAWESPPGNLAASLLIVPVADPPVTATLGFVAGVALNRALRSLMPGLSVRLGLDGADGRTESGPARIALKWPNDVLVDGAKLAGILLEGQMLDSGRQAVVIGFGVNVVAAPQALPYPATSLAALGCAATAEDVFEALSGCWLEALALWQDGEGLPKVLDEWRGAAAGIGAPVAISRHGDVLRGIFETVDGAGRLILRDERGDRIAITAGDVHFGAVASAAG